MPHYISPSLRMVRMHDFINYTFKSSYGEPQICANTLLSILLSLTLSSPYIYGDENASMTTMMSHSTQNSECELLKKWKENKECVGDVESLIETSSEKRKLYVYINTRIER